MQSFPLALRQRAADWNIPGDRVTLEYTNAKSHELQAICEEFDEITTVPSIAGYEILTQGRGSNAGTCLISLKPWAERKPTSEEIIEELERKGSAISNDKLEFYEPPAVPGFGAAGGFSLNLMDKTCRSAELLKLSILEQCCRRTPKQSFEDGVPKLELGNEGELHGVPFC